MSATDPLTWDDMVAMFKRLTQREPYRYFVNPRTMHRMMTNASDAERAALDIACEKKIIIISAEVPEGPFYRFDATLIPDGFL